MNGAINLQAQGRIGLVNSLDAEIVLSPFDGMGLDLKKNGVDTKEFAVATMLMAMTSFYSSVYSQGDGRLSSIVGSVPIESNFRVPNVKPSVLFVIAPLGGYQWMRWRNPVRGSSVDEKGEDLLVGNQTNLGFDFENASAQFWRLGLQSWYLHPRSLGDPSNGFVLGFRYLAIQGSYLFLQCHFCDGFFC